MPKHYKYILLLLSFFIGFSSVLAEGTCSFTNPYYNSGEFTPGVHTNADGDALIYEITNVNMENEDVFSIYGWAFSSIHDCHLNGGETGSDAKIWLYFYPIGEEGNKEEYVYLDIEYATEATAGCVTSGCADGKPKYFDYTFWNCYKKRVDGKNMCYSSNDGSGNVHGLASPILQGGFKGTLNLKEAYDSGKLKKDTDYRLHMLFQRGNSLWRDRDVSVFTGKVNSSVKEYDGFELEDGSMMDIKISGFGEKAEMLVRDGIPQGKSGLGCDSHWSNTIYYTKGDQYIVDKADTNTSCRGKIGELCTSSGNGAGQVNLYKLYTDSRARATSNEGSISGYTPASWIVFDGTIDITTKTKEEDDPDICEGDEIYYLYYYFADGVAKDFKGNINYTANFKDAKILQELEFESNSDMTIEGGPLSSKTIKKSFDTYYNNFWSAIESGQGYIEQDGKYYLVPDEFHKWPGGGSYSFSSEKGYDQDSLTTHNQKSFNRNPSGTLGYKFSVQESVDYTDSKNIPKSIRKGTKATDFQNMYKHFTVYQLTVCRNEEEKAQCEDEVVSTVCEDGDTGTHAIYHENDDIKNCTLNNGINSGFTFVQSGFGEAACKEDLDIYLPTHKKTAAGQYYLLNLSEGSDEVPKIKGHRTCATTPIKYSELDSKLKALESTMPTTYNHYRDSLFIYKQVKAASVAENPAPEKVPCATSKTWNDSIQDYEYTYGEYTLYHWELKIGSPDGPNNLEHFTPNPHTGTWVPDGDICLEPPDPGKTKEQFKQDIVDEWEQKTWSYKNSYDGSLLSYHNTIIDYNKMFSWTETVVDTNYHASGSIDQAAHIDTQNGYVDTKYTFNPMLTFNYGLPEGDPDSQVFPTPYSYKYRPEAVGGVSESKTYWSENAEPNNEYTDGGASLDPRPRELINCKKGGETCEETTTITGEFYHNGAVRRDEEVEYEYSLPHVTTTIPDGRVYGEGRPQPNNGKTSLDLPKEAVPVNINIIEGVKNYTFSIEYLKDELRTRMESLNPIDDWGDAKMGSHGKYALPETRFVKRKVLNNGTLYICDYDVINDIYLPGPQKFNFFYRVVDTYNINPLGRTLGYNWTDVRATNEDIGVIPTIKQDALDVTHLKEDHEKFVYTLNPLDMQEIRKYNATRDEGYADWDLVCNDYDTGGYHCRSNFLECLVGGGTGCSNISANHDSDNTFNGETYTYEDFKRNRDAFIAKQNALDELAGIGGG